MSNSKLVSYTKLSPNCNKPKKSKIKKITIHHMAGDMTIENCLNMFANPLRKGSCNYAIGSDGRIGLGVEETNRSWCSSSPENDHQAVTIEVANDQSGGNWHVSDKALASLINLCVDICKRNDIAELVYTGDKSGNLTRHNMFSATACPGPYLQSKFPYIASEVNKRLKAGTVSQPKPIQQKPIAGLAIKLCDTPLFVTATATNCVRKITGTYYLYDGILTSGRYRITNNPSRVNKTPLGANVTGWINAGNVK